MAEQSTTTDTTTQDKSTDDINSLKDKIAALEKEKTQWTSTKNEQELSLNDKAKRDRDDQDKKSSDSKALEAALMFNISSPEFLKQHESILPKGADDIFKLADKEKYDSPIQKANAIRAALIDLYFSQQSNNDFLTEYHKESLAEYQKLTKNGKEEKSKEIYENIFKPALNTMKQVKKAEELSKGKQGLGGNTDADQALKDKMIKMGEKKFFKGKN